MKNKLWFFGAFRQAYYDKPIANTFQTDGSVPFPAGLRSAAPAARARASRASPTRRWTTRSSASPGRCRSATSSRSTSDRALRLRGHAMGVADRPEHRVGDLEHAELRDRLAEVDLDAVVEAAARGRHLVQPRALRQPLPARHLRRARHRRRGTATSRKDDTSTGFLWNASSAQLGNYPDRYNVQGGALVRDRRAQREGRRAWISSGIYRRYNNANADLYQTYNNGAPLQRHRAQHAARSAGEPRRQLRHLRPGLVEPRAS